MVCPDLDELEAYLMDRSGYPATIEIGGTVAKELLAIVRTQKELVAACEVAIADIESMATWEQYPHPDDFEPIAEKLRAALKRAKCEA